MTGLSPEQLDLLIDRVADQVGTWQPPRGRHHRLDLAAAVTMTLVWLRHNLSQALLGAFYGISQATVSRITTRLGELVTWAANQGMPGLAQTRPGERLLLDGSLLPTGQRAGQEGQDLYNGKRHQAGMNVQVISDRWGGWSRSAIPHRGRGRCTMRGHLWCVGWAVRWPTGRRWPILAFSAVGSSRRCASRRVGSCASWRRPITAPMPVLVRRWSEPLRCSSSGELWAVGIAGRRRGSRRCPDGGGVGKAPNLRKPIVNNAQYLAAMREARSQFGL